MSMVSIDSLGCVSAEVPSAEVPLAEIVLPQYHHYHHSFMNWIKLREVYSGYFVFRHIFRKMYGSL